MSDSLQLILLETLRQKISEIPGIQSCYLDRHEPVGDNELKPLVIINSAGSEYSKQASHTIRIEKMIIQVEIHAPFSTETTLSRLHDPWFSAVDTVMDTQARTVLGHQGVDLISSTMLGESGWLGYLLLTYNLEQIHQQGNRSAVPGIP